MFHRTDDIIEHRINIKKNNKDKNENNKKKQK